MKKIFKTTLKISLGVLFLSPSFLLFGGDDDYYIPSMDQEFQVPVAQNILDESPAFEVQERPRNLTRRSPVVQERERIKPPPGLKILQFFPGHEEKNVNPENPITVQFENRDNPELAKKVRLQLKDSSQKSYPVAFSLDEKGNRMFFHVKGMVPGKRYFVRLDYPGEGYKGESIQWNFVAGNPVVPLKIIGTNPDSKSPLSLDGPILVKFNSEIDPASVSRQTIFLHQGKERLSFDLQISPDDLTMTLTPKEPLKPGNNYNMTLANLRGKKGGTLTQSVSFQTKSYKEATSPKIGQFFPGVNQTGFPVDGLVEINFDRPMKGVTLNDFTFRLTDDFGPIPASVNYQAGKERAVLKPAAPLENGKKYTVTVLKSVLSEEEIPLANNYRWTFTTEEKAVEAQEPDVAADFPPPSFQLPGKSNSNPLLGGDQIAQKSSQMPTPEKNGNFEEESSSLDNLIESLEEDVNLLERRVLPTQTAPIRGMKQNSGLPLNRVTRVKGLKPVSPPEGKVPLRKQNREKPIPQMEGEAPPIPEERILTAKKAPQKREVQELEEEGQPTTRGRKLFLLQDMKEEVKSGGYNPYTTVLDIIEDEEPQVQSARGKRKLNYHFKGQKGGASLVKPAMYGFGINAYGAKKPNPETKAKGGWLDSIKNAFSFGSGGETSPGESSPTSQAFDTLPSNHWTLNSLNHFARMGLIPPQGKGPTSPTRYEIVSTVQTLLNNFYHLGRIQGPKPKMTLDDLIKLGTLVMNFRKDLVNYGADPVPLENILKNQRIDLGKIQAEVHNLNQRG